MKHFVNNGESLLDEMNNKLSGMDLFRHCGEKTSFEFITQSATKSQAVKLCKSTKWSNVRLEEVNELTDYLCLNHRELYDQNYNSLVIFVKQSYIQPLIEKYRSEIQSVFLDKSETVISMIKWDILHFFIFQYYRDYYSSDFYHHLLQIYEAGHFPCGWKGEYPAGEIIVY